MTGEVLIRLSAFILGFGVMGSWELVSPRRRLTTSKARRWVTNVSVVALDAVMIPMLFATGAVGVAMLAAERNLCIKFAAIVVVGPSPAAVLIFEVLLNATSMFNHSNVRMPATVDRFLRCIVVTPDMHRIHHSVNPRETNRNFGFNLPWWDRLLGTYRVEPAQGHEGMTPGLEQFRDPARLIFIGTLALLFVGAPGAYPLSRED